MTSPQEASVLLKSVDEQGICTLTLNRPGQLNALNGELVRALWDTFYELAYQDEVRVVVLTASTEKAFCVGADLKERKTMSEVEVRQRIDDYGRCFGTIASLPKPTICAINGYAFGGGLELALACDLRIMRQDTRVGLTELKLGIIPGAGGTQRLPRQIGLSRAKQMIFTGARLDGAQAKDWGVVDEIASAQELLPTAYALAAQMLDSAPIALAQAKLAIDAGMQTDLETGLKLESRAYAVTIPTQDRLEGLAAFAEGRKPRFTGK